MSKIILSSCDFRNSESAKCIYENLPCPVQQCKVLFFPNEKATEEAIKSEKFYNRLSEFGFRKENIYIFNYFAPADFDVGNHVDAVYISGGNTFGTLKRIRESGAEKIIMECLSCGAVYIGGSAGAHIASRSVGHVAKYDHDTFGLTDFSGLNLLDGVLICHYTEEREADYLDLVKSGERNIIILRDCDSVMFS